MDSSIRPSSSFRIKVDLTDFGAERLVWYLVNSQTQSVRRRVCDTIGQLHRNIRRRFLNENRSHKMGATEVWLDDAAVPDDESVELLSSNDTIAVRLRRTQLSECNEEGDQDSNATSITDKDTVQSSKKTKKRRIMNGDRHNAMAANDKDVYYAVEYVRKKTKKSKGKKERDPEDLLQDAIPEEDEEEETAEESVRSNKKRKKSKKRKHQEDPEVESEEGEQIEWNVSKRTESVIEQQVVEAVVEAQRTRKDKRKDRTSLRRKRKRVLERSLKRAKNINGSPKVSIEAVESIAISENGDQALQTNMHPASTTMHIRFTEQADSTVIGQRRCNGMDEVEQKQKTEWAMEPQSEFSIDEGPARINTQTNSSQHFKKMAQRDVLTNNSVTVSRNSIDCEQLNGANGILLSNEAPVKDYTQYPLLEGPPRINDVICYKLLELSENYTPEVSDYKVANVLKYDSSLQELLLEFPQPIALYSKRGKFELTCAADDDEDEEPPIYVKETTLNLTSLLEARLITDF